VVTIGLGNLEELVIQRDVAKLIDSLVFGTNSAASGPTNIFFTKLAKALGGEQAPDRYKKLIDYLSEVVDMASKRTRLNGLAAAKNVSVSDKASRMRGLWSDYLDEIKKSRPRIQDQGRKFVAEAIAEMENTKRDLVIKGYSLSELREEFRVLETLLTATLEEAQKDTRTTIDDTPVSRQLDSLNQGWLSRFFNRGGKVKSLASLMQRNLSAHLQETARDTALGILEELQFYCVEAGLNLDVILGKLRKQRDDQEGWAKGYRAFRLQAGHPLQILALSDEREINEYAEKVSIFPTRSKGRISSLNKDQGSDQLADFRKWLEGKEEFEALFKGNVTLLSNVAIAYTSERVHEAMKEKGHKVLDILIQAGEDTLLERLKEAESRATALVSYSKSFAPDRREAWHVSADYGSDNSDENLEKRRVLENAVTETFVQGQAKLLPSNDPTEIAVFYYVDGIPMSAVEDLKGRCLDAFLKRRKQWHDHQVSLNGNSPVASIGSVNQRVGVPVYSSKDAEERVIETGVIHRLYEVKGAEVGDYKVEDIPELAAKPIQANIPLTADLNDQNGHAGQNGHTGPLASAGQKGYTSPNGHTNQATSANEPAQETEPDQTSS
jgi:hypothetical protein